MKKIIYTFLFTFFILSNAKANDNLLYKYKINLKQNSFSNTEDISEFIKIFAHTNDIEKNNSNTEFLINTIYPINTSVFIGKAEKKNINIQEISLIDKKIISEEAIDKIEKAEKEKAVEWNKSSKK